MVVKPNIKRPFSYDQIKSINEFQLCRYYHPYTCGEENCTAQLIATREGMICPECGRIQLWAHEWTANWEWKLEDFFINGDKGSWKWWLK